MIDEKKLIENLLQDDGMEFSVILPGDRSPEKVCNAFQEFANKMKEGFVNLINAQPKVSGGGGWIPVNERLPKNYVRVLVRVRYGDIGIAHRSGKWFVWDWEDEDNDGPITSVTHWMPLPEPPEVGGGA